MGVGEVRIEGTQKAAVDDGTQYYLIKSGDTLSAIAKQFYGDANKYQAIFDANREVIKDANLIFPGQKIRIPKLWTTARVASDTKPGRGAPDVQVG